MRNCPVIRIKNTRVKNLSMPIQEVSLEDKRLFVSYIPLRLLLIVCTYLVSNVKFYFTDNIKLNGYDFKFKESKYKIH